MAGHALEVLSPTEVSDLDTLAKQIDAAHVDVGTALLASVQRAAEAGHLLAQAKAQVPHGQWETWVAENTAVSPRTARGYMQVARYWLEATKAKRRALAVLGLQGLLAEIAKPHRIPAEPVEPEDPAAAPAEPRITAVRFRGEDVVSGPKTIAVPASSAPALDQTEDLERAGDPEQDLLAATMKSVQEAEERSGASRRITGDSIQSAANLDGINREWDKLDMAGRDKFLSEKLRSHGHPDHNTDIIDV